MVPLRYEFAGPPVNLGASRSGWRRVGESPHVVISKLEN